ncbi:MAG: D-2-hydroxyacid dehydrogenase, partial [Anaerolineaceae bacterium]|nr:D-2-hydroxyacid dehydrogenase [Anaerolineaceae bacterium]
VVSMLLALGHHLPEILACQKKAEWLGDSGERFIPRELRGSVVGIVGYGSIGREVARLLQPFGVTLLAAKRDAMQPEDKAYIPAGLGDAKGTLFTRLYPIEALRSMLKLCDYVVVTLPLTPRTRGLIGKEALKTMKSTAYIVDVSRGGVINEEALVAALQEKRIAGAALDVFNQEPLPPKSPLWALPNVILSPHISGSSVHYRERALALFQENLKLYLAGEALHNRIDLVKGY